MTKENQDLETEKKEDVSTEEKEETDSKEKTDSDKTVDELKQEAEEAERSYKEKRGTASEEELRQNMIRRRDKAMEKAQRISSEPKGKDFSVDVRDLIILAKNEIEEDSDKAQILEKYRSGGIISSYKEGLNHPAIQAEFKALEAKDNAESVIDESESDARLRTTKEVISSYKKGGDVPQDPKAKKAIADDNLKEMGL